MKTNEVESMLKTNKASGARGLIRIEDNKYEDDDDDSARNKADGDV